MKHKRALFLKICERAFDEERDCMGIVAYIAMSWSEIHNAASALALKEADPNTGQKSWRKYEHRL